MKKKTTPLSKIEIETLEEIKYELKNWPTIPVTITDIAWALDLSWSAIAARVKKLITRKLIKRNKKGHITLVK